MQSETNAVCGETSVLGAACLILSGIVIMVAGGFTQPAGAGTFTDVCVAARLCDPPAAPSVTIDILCDTTAVCSVETLKATLVAAFSYAAERPGSQVRVWMMTGPGATDTKKLYTSDPTETPPKAKKEYAIVVGRYVERELPRVLAFVEPLLLGPAPNRSPIAESLTLVAWADVRTARRKIWLLSDGKQEGGAGRFECIPLPSEEEWMHALVAAQLLGPKTLDHVDVTFAFATVNPVVGRRHCPAWTIAKESAQRALWTYAVGRAGGVLHFTTGAPLLADDFEKGGSGK